MKTTKAKIFLRKLKRLDMLIKNKIVEKEQWRAMAFSTAAPVDGERVQASGDQQKMENAVANYIDLDKEIDEAIDRLVDARKEVISVIEQLPDLEYDVMHMIYVQYLGYEEVAEYYGKSYSWATSIHGRGLKHVQEILDRDNIS